MNTCHLPISQISQKRCPPIGLTHDLRSGATPLPAFAA
jgi:hypothetical protein